MDNIHDWINSVVLLLFGVLSFMQDKTLKYMKTAMEAINPEKIIKAQEIIDKGKDYELKLKMSAKSKEIISDTAIKFQETHKELIGKYEELLAFPFSVLSEKNWEERERSLIFYPKNSENLRILLKAFDDGKLNMGKEKGDDNIPS